MSWKTHEAAERIADGWHSELEYTRKRNAVLGRENTKLRELIKCVISRYNDMNREYWGNQEPLPCDLCNMERQCSEVSQHDRCLFYEYLRELGVEVGNG